MSPLLKPIVLAALPIFLVGVVGWPTATLAQSIIAAPDGTATLVTPSGTQFTITGGQLSGDGANLFHSFSQFGLSQGEIATFLANPTLQNILARVVGGDPSVINGLLQVSGGNANLFLLNPAGIVFGPNASLNVPGAFTATTANGIGFGANWFSATGLNDYQALVGQPGSYAFLSSQPGSIVNAGNLAVGPGQTLTLLGGTVVSTGTLTAPGGQITVAAIPGEKLVRLSQVGSPLSLDIQPLSSAATLPNSLLLTPQTLPQLLTGGKAGNATGVTVNSQGQVMLTGSGMVIPSVPGTAIVSGAIDVANPHQGQYGGSVAVLGNQVGLVDQSSVNASGSAGGGTVLIGGDYLGQGSVANAVVTFIGQNVAIQADALSRGNGGKVIVWSDQTTRTYGTISARGGPQGGNGGFVETSSKGFLDVLRNPDVSAPLGLSGTWLIDPYDITIIAGTPGSGSLDPLTPDFTANANSSTISNLAIRNALLGGNVTISTGTGGSQAGNITVAASIITPASTTLTLLAANDIVFESGVEIDLSNGSGGSVVLTAGGAVDIGNITTSSGPGPVAGNVTITAGKTITVGNIIASVTAGIVDSQGGTVILRTTPAFGGDIQFGYIDASVTISGSANATGGTVQIAANGTVQGTGFDTFGATINASPRFGIVNNAGRVSITHDGGPDNLPFELESASANGLAGNINVDGTGVTGDFPVLPNGGTVSAGTNISITSINSPPTLTADPLISSFEPDVPIEFTYEDLKIQVADANGDTIFIVIDDILGGILLVNGEIVGPGTTLEPGDELEFIPFPDAFELEDQVGFIIRASDRVSESEPFTVTALQDVGEVELREEDSELVDPSNILVGEVSEFGELAELEGDFTEDYTAYYDLPSVQSVTLADSQSMLSDIAAKTGIKPALVYARFMPSGIEAPDKGTKPAAEAPGPAGEIIWQFNPQGLSTEVFPRRAGSGKGERKELDSDQLELLMVTAEGEPLRKRVPGASRAVVRKLAQEFRQSVTNPSSEDYLVPAQELYRILIAPLEAQMKLKGIDNLTFLTDTGLRSLPLAALHDGKQFLVEKYSLGLMPSLSLTDTRYVNIQQSRVLAMGASRFQEQSPLPAVPEELAAIAGQIWAGRSFLNQNFTIKNLQAQRQQGNYGILHLATHGEFRAGSPSNSYIQFWDSKLQLDQIRQLKLSNPPIELLVLSACRTALGDRQAELGFAGLAVQAGVKSALGSLWYVSDEGTLALMTEFYQNLKATPVKTEALRRAQLAMLQGKVQVKNGQLSGPRGAFPLPPELAKLEVKSLAHPYYWAAFTMIGNPW